MNVIKTWNGKTIRFRESDNYGCLTDMAKASGKNFGHWNENKATKEYLDALSSVIGKPITELLQVVQGGEPENQGTWADRKVCLRFAQWCSPDFAVQVDVWIEELMTKGSVSLKPMTLGEFALASGQAMVAQSQAIIALEKSHLALANRHEELAESSNKRFSIVELLAKNTAEKVDKELAGIKNSLAKMQEFAVAQPPSLDRTLADQINHCFQIIGGALIASGLYTPQQKDDAFRAPWTQLGLTMRNSDLNYDLNARYANAKRQYEAEYAAWKANGSPRGFCPKKLTRVDVLMRDNKLNDAFSAAQHVAKNYASKIN